MAAKRKHSRDRNIQVFTHTKKKPATDCFEEFASVPSSSKDSASRSDTASHNLVSEKDFETDDLGYICCKAIESDSDFKKEVIFFNEQEYIWGADEIDRFSDTEDTKDVIVQKTEECDKKPMDDDGQAHQKQRADSGRTAESSPSTTVEIPIEKRMVISFQPFELFRLFFNDKLLDVIVAETNRSFDKLVDVDPPLTRYELLTFFGLVIHMGAIKKYKFEEYWRESLADSICSNNIIYKHYMTITRFKQILSCLKLQSIVLDHFNNLMKNIYTPNRNLIVDNSAIILGHSGRNLLLNDKNRDISICDNNKQTTAMVHALMDADTGIFLNLAISHGLRMNNADGINFELMKQYFYSGYSVFMTENYISFRTAKFLLTKQIYCTGRLYSTSVAKTEVALKENEKHRNPKSSAITISKYKDQFYLSTGFPQLSGDRADSAGAVYESMMARGYMDYPLLKYYPCRGLQMPWEARLYLHLLQVVLVNISKLCPQYSFEALRTYLLDILLPVPSSLEHSLVRIEQRVDKDCSDTVVENDKGLHHCSRCFKVSRVLTAVDTQCRQCPLSPPFCVECFNVVHHDAKTNSQTDVKPDIEEAKVNVVEDIVRDWNI